MTMARGTRKDGGRVNCLAPALLILPALLLMGTMFVGIGILVAQSLAPAEGSSLDLYRRAITTPYYAAVLLRSLRLAGWTTLCCLLLGFPIAYYMETTSQRWRSVIFFGLVLMFFTEYVMRVYSLVLIIGAKGIVNQGLLALGVISEPLRMMYTEVGVTFGLVTGNVIFMVLTISGVIARIDPELRHAAILLGATEWQVFRRVTLPLSVPGIVAGSTIVFLLSMSAYLTPNLLGGGRVKMIANVIFDEAVSMLNLPMGATLALLLLIITIAIIGIVNRVFGHFRHHFGVT
jgi:putative spermidine/putrescine transport system permease protein